MNKKDLAKYIDHTLLKATATEEDILNLCGEAKKYQFFAIFSRGLDKPLRDLYNIDVKNQKSIDGDSRADAKEQASRVRCEPTSGSPA